MRIPDQESTDLAPSPQFEFRVHEAARDSVASTFSEVVSEKSVVRAIEDLVRLAEELRAEYEEVEPPASPIHCRAGCSHCCHMRIHATAPEVILLAQFIRKTFSEAQFRDLRLYLEEADKITGGMSDEEHGKAGVACPLLVDHHCSAYEARPLECRGYVSMSVDACREASRNYDAWNVPLYYPQYSIFKNVQIGLLAALVGAGYDIELLELTGALRIALEVPDTAEQWLAGQDVFRPAALPPSDPEIIAIRPWTPTFETPLVEVVATRKRSMNENS